MSKNLPQEIEECRQCCYYRKYLGNGEMDRIEWCDKKDKMIKKIVSTNLFCDIPDWCPLEDYESE